MPTYLRNFYASELIKVKKKEKEEINKANNQSNYTPPNIPQR